jgi:hypothetical protein
MQAFVLNVQFAEIAHKCGNNMPLGKRLVDEMSAGSASRTKND